LSVYGALHVLGGGGGRGGPAHTDVNFGGKKTNLGAAPHDWGFAKKVSCSRVMGQKLSSGRPCIPALPGTHNLFASPLTALLTTPFIITSYIIAILEV